MNVKTADAVFKKLAADRGLKVREDDGMSVMRTLYGLRWGLQGYSDSGDKVYGYVEVDEQAIGGNNYDVVRYLDAEIARVQREMRRYVGPPKIKLTEAPPWSELARVAKPQKEKPEPAETWNELGEVAP